MEAEFFRSFAFLQNSYELPVLQYDNLPFPQNVAAAYAEAAAAVKKLDANANCIIVRDEKHLATLAVLKTYDTGRCLYYIPVRPLWHLVQTAEQQPLAELLLSIYSYLYQVAGIPFYSESGSYMDCQYDSLQNWIDEAEYDSVEDQACADEQTKEMDTLRSAGEGLLVLLRDRRWLDSWEANLAAYRQTAGCRVDFVELAEQLLALYRAYPQNGLFDNIRDDLIEPEENERIRGEQYISFYWSGNDCFYDMLFEMVNNDFQECGITDEPTSIRLFDTLQATKGDDLAYERKLFELIDGLCEFLNPYDHDEHQ
ncbi:hypothetical protein ABDD95_07675 [Mucilaginibacter sp. PAMB04274]|uniref:hypothetical protein n=1 Tax=Mucilaginibacter sp. PAMB04274 TaxID=3138568 RepID=UPI0031F67CEA